MTGGYDMVKPTLNSPNAALGRWGEDLAAAEYQRRGYAVIDRNWRCPDGEIDLVMRRDDTIVFCEVKTRRSDVFGTASTAVDQRKQVRVRRLGAAWLAAHGERRGDVRFDVAAIDGVHLEIIEAAF